MKPAAPQSVSVQGDSATTVPDILIDRDRPAHSGWCGNENCKHLSCKDYSRPAEATA